MVGDIALALFPFTNLQDAKIRPVLVVADVTYPSEQDWMVCEVTSQPRVDVLQLPIGDGDIASGRLLRSSWVRPDRVMTLNEEVFRQTIARLTDSKTVEILASVRSLF
ncbi:MAG: type II toxin-antitoxin system PemK/MazF family toxin [Chloroflexota bacterium]|nr:type II toxin-antitoxin system PemK/MazF family toxin [Chloroflexota bacterium]MDE2682946.1 type II toxin-antitoxin system PemK/MazF family toxin [Chloroflexota bacterium]